MCEHSYKLGESRPSLKIVVASHRLCSQIFGFSEILAKEMRPAISDFDHDGYFWITNSITMNSTYVQRFYRDKLMMRKLYMSELGMSYKTHVEVSRMETNVDIHIQNDYSFHVELNIFGGSIIGKYLCLRGEGYKKVPLYNLKEKPPDAPSECQTLSVHIV